MAKPICPICLKNYTQICATCDVCGNCVDVNISCLALRGTGQYEDMGIMFDSTTWDQHWDVVKRRLEEGTEDRQIENEGDFLFIFACDEKMGSPSIWVNEREFLPYSWYRKHWRFVDRPKSIGFSIELKKDENNHTCRCGHRMYIGLSGAFCESCGAFNY